jgi:hypothetical protein
MLCLLLKGVKQKRMGETMSRGDKPGFCCYVFFASASTIRSRMTNFCGLPVIVIGSSPTTRKWRGIL